jgi:hypothetical protein
LRATKICRKWYWARAVQIAPRDAPMIAADFPDHALSP